MESRTAGAFFDGFADTFDTIYEGKRSPFMQWIDRRFRSDLLERYRLSWDRLGNLSGRCGLDVGCGSGPYVVEALRRGAANIIAVDPAPRMLDLTRRRVEKAGCADRVTLLEGYFPQTRPSRKCDFALVMGVMDYVADAADFLRGLREVVDGPAVISFPSRHWFRTPIRRIRYRLRRCPLHFYDEDRIRSLASTAGFSEPSIFKIPGAGMDYHVCLCP